MNTADYLRQHLKGAKSNAADVLKAYAAGEVDDRGNPIAEQQPVGRQPDYSQGRGNVPSLGHGARNALNGAAVTDGIAETLRRADPGADIRVDGTPHG